MENETNIVLTCRECSDEMYPNKGKFDVKVGEFAKIRFEAENGLTSESMWIKVTKVNGDELEGVLDNDPIFIKSVKYGDIVKFKKEGVLLAAM